MAFHVRPATEEHDEGVSRLFYEAQVAIEEPYFERAFSPSQPGKPAQPLIAVDHDGAVLGFLSARPVELFIEGDYSPTVLIHDFVVAPGEIQRDVAAILLKDAQKLGDVAVVAGAGVELARLLNQLGLQQLGHFARLRMNPEEKPRRESASIQPLPLKPADKFPQEVEELNKTLAAERRIYRRRSADQLNWQFRGPAGSYEIWISSERSPCDAYAVLRRVEGRGAPELQLVDGACQNVDLKRMAAALAETGRARRLPVYVSVFANNWFDEFAEWGFEVLRPRWPLHWILRDPRQRLMGGALLRADHWFFTPADGEVDHW